MTFLPFFPEDIFEPRDADERSEFIEPPHRLGVYVSGDGVDVSVMAGHATDVHICFFEGTRSLLDPAPNQAGVTAPNEANVQAPPADCVAPTEHSYSLHPNLYGIWTGHIPGIQPGAVYGFRAYGPWEPTRGLMYNPAKVLLDPYARAIAQPPLLHSSLFAHEVRSDLTPAHGFNRDEQNSVRYAPLGMVMAEQKSAEHVHIPWDKTVIYEAHVVGLTKQHNAVPPELRGTYAGVAHPAVIEHLQRIGVTTLELLPIYAKMSEPFLGLKGLTNYWGYNTLNFFAPEPSYATLAAQQAGPQAVFDEVRSMVAALHNAGIEVVLDVVYNHTSEAGMDGPTTSFRGLDHLAYYRYDSSNPGCPKDTTGCGNSLDFRRRAPLELTLESLRYWVDKVGIDGFRFDLAVTLGREGDSFNPHHPLFVATLNDPILRGVKLINEPWDVGPNGWQTGNFAEGTADWNDRFRDTVRRFWLGDVAALHAGGQGMDMREVATRISGSADIFGHGRTRGGRGVFSSVNFVTAHDGFSLWDLVSFNTKHNEANLEDNRDGSTHNGSWNHGVEGHEDVADLPDGGVEILAARRRAARNLMGTLALSSGTPMLRAGDELLKSQGGNNNSYCQDSPISWLDWDTSEPAQNMCATLAYLLKLRVEHPTLRPRHFFTGRRIGDDALKDLEWFDASGYYMPDHKWFDPHVRVLQMLRSGVPYANECPADRDALIVINGTLDATPVTLAPGRGAPYELMWCSAWESPAERATADDLWFPEQSEWEIPALSIALFLS